MDRSESVYVAAGEVDDAVRNLLRVQKKGIVTLVLYLDIRDIEKRQPG